MKGDSRWVTALHYAFQDEEYLVRIPGKVGGVCLGAKKEALGGQRHWVPPPGTNQLTLPTSSSAWSLLSELWLGAGCSRAAGRHSPASQSPEGPLGCRAMGQVPPISV